jgi:membrane fusion protein (multidrug efflux system)
VAVEEVKAAPNRRPLFVLGFLIVAVVGAIGIHSMLTANEESTDDAQVEADVVPLAARVSGMVIAVKATDNQTVKKGDVLLELDPADFIAREKQAEAQLLTAKAQADVADAQAQVVEATARGGLSTAKAVFSGSSVAVSSADAQIASAKASELRAQSDLNKATLDLARAKELFAATAIPKERLDNAQASFDSATAALAVTHANVLNATELKRAAESRVQEAKGRLDQSTPIDAQIAAAHAQAALAHANVTAAEASLDLAKNQLTYTKVYAPNDGTLAHFTIREGQLIQMGQPITSLVPSKTYLVGNFKETQVGRIKPGQKVDIEVDAFPGKKLEGTVESVQGGTGARFSLLPPDNASGNFVKVVQRVPVRVAFTKTEDVALRAGLSADVTIHVK